MGSDRDGLQTGGVDLIERTTSSGVTLGFPVYDAHGNNVATLSRSGAGYSVSDRRVYSAWGDVRGGQPLGDPKGRGADQTYAFQWRMVREGVAWFGSQGPLVFVEVV